MSGDPLSIVEVTEDEQADLNRRFAEFDPTLIARALTHFRVETLQPSHSAFHPVDEWDIETLELVQSGTPPEKARSEVEKRQRRARREQAVVVARRAFDRAVAAETLEDFVAEGFTIEACLESMPAHTAHDLRGAMRPVLAAKARKLVDQPQGDGPSSWEPQDIADTVAGLVAGTLQAPVPSLLRRDDGRALFYAESVNALWGESGSAKTWAALVAVAQELALGNDVVFLDFEDGPVGIISRLLQLGMTGDRIKAHLHYVRPEGPPSEAEFKSLCERVAEVEATLVVVDSAGEWLGLQGTDSYHDTEYAGWVQRYVVPLARRPGVVLIDHLPHDNSGLLRPIGSQRKKASITGAAYMVRQVTAMGRAVRGVSQLVAAKDKHGSFVVGLPAADLVLDASAAPYVVELVAPDGGAAAEARGRTQDVRRAVWQAIRLNPRDLTETEVARDKDGGIGGTETLRRQALADLLARGLVERVIVERHRSDGRPYRVEAFKAVDELLDPEALEALAEQL